MNDTSMTPHQIDRIARKRAGAKLGWYIHATVYLLVNAVLFLIANNFGAGHRSWSIFPALGWGLGLLLHGVAVFVLGNGSGLHERMVERERRKIRG